MFKQWENARALLFEYEKPVLMKIHSLFVFFPFVAIWLDKKNKIIQIKEVKPFTFSVSAKNDFSKLVEMPINKKYKEKIKALGFPRR